LKNMDLILNDVIIAQRGEAACLGFADESEHSDVILFSDFSVKLVLTPGSDEYELDVSISPYQGLCHSPSCGVYTPFLCNVKLGGEMYQDRYDLCLSQYSLSGTESFRGKLSYHMPANINRASAAYVSFFLDSLPRSHVVPMNCGIKFGKSYNSTPFMSVLRFVGDEHKYVYVVDFRIVFGQIRNYIPDDTQSIYQYCSFYNHIPSYSTIKIDIPSEPCTSKLPPNYYYNWENDLFNKYNLYCPSGYAYWTGNFNLAIDDLRESGIPVNIVSSDYNPHYGWIDNGINGIAFNSVSIDSVNCTNEQTVIYCADPALDAPKTAGGESPGPFAPWVGQGTGGYIPPANAYNDSYDYTVWESGVFTPGGTAGANGTNPTGSPTHSESKFYPSVSPSTTILKPATPLSSNSKSTQSSSSESSSSSTGEKCYEDHSAAMEELYEKQKECEAGFVPKFYINSLNCVEGSCVAGLSPSSGSKHSSSSNGSSSSISGDCYESYVTAQTELDIKSEECLNQGNRPNFAVNGSNCIVGSCVNRHENSQSNNSSSSEEASSSSSDWEMECPAETSSYQQTSPLSGGYFVDNNIVYAYGDVAYNTKGQYLGFAEDVIFSKIPQALSKRDKTATRNLFKDGNLTEQCCVEDFNVRLLNTNSDIGVNDKFGINVKFDAKFYGKEYRNECNPSCCEFKQETKGSIIVNGEYMNKTTCKIGGLSVHMNPVVYIPDCYGRSCTNIDGINSYDDTLGTYNATDFPGLKDVREGDNLNISMEFNSYIKDRCNANEVKSIIPWGFRMHGIVPPPFDSLEVILLGDLSP